MQAERNPRTTHVQTKAKQKTAHNLPQLTRKYGLNLNYLFNLGKTHLLQQQRKGIIWNLRHANQKAELQEQDRYSEPLDPNIPTTKISTNGTAHTSLTGARRRILYDIQRGAGGVKRTSDTQ